MSRYFASVILGISLFFFYGCDLKTPEIRGIVIDAESQKPVEGAWIHGTIWLESKTVAGSSGKVISIESPHTRTGKDGKFIIPARELKKAPFPIEIGTQVTKFTIGAATVKKSGQNEIRVNELESSKIDVTISLEDIEKVWKKELAHVPAERFEEEKEQREFSGLQALYNYCFTGRFSAEIPAVENGCDDWELNYVIYKHESYLIKHKDEIKSGYYNALGQLSELYERNSNCKKAIEILQKQISFMVRHGLLGFEAWRKNKSTVEKRINVLKGKCQKE